ncbi:MAG: ABC transporter ATP-binding protein [Acidobacteria bacterium]|nr:ABC transporter ATP-binding protein [Acidobacteriota bacterium]
MNEPLVKVEHLGKKFCRRLKRSLWYGVKDIGAELTGSRKSRSKLRKDEFWALQDVNFEIYKGEMIGLIGANGAGKTTLLKLLSCLIKPDLGEISIRGKIQALIALGAGFNPILTGRENIYINGAVLGFSKREMDKLLQEIMDFSEMSEFIDMPVQSYSSGMHVRLGFAVAVNLKPDILIVDEVLAVGDASFRRKARNKMMELLHSGISVLFVSHNMALVSSLTSRCIYLDRGSVKAVGPSDEITSLYLSDSIKKAKASQKASHSHLMNSAYMTMPDLFILHDLRLYNQNDIEGDEFSTYDDIKITLDMEFVKELENVLLAINIRDQVDDVVISSSKLLLNSRPNKGRMTVECNMTRNRFREGNYNVGFYVLDYDGGGLYKTHAAVTFSIMADMSIIKHNDPTKGFVVMDATWQVINDPNA